MAKRQDRVELADRRDRDYGQDWKDHRAFQRWKDGPSSLEFILDAKSRGAVGALPMLLHKRTEDSEEGGEALDAVFVIIKKNPGNREILALVPDLVSALSSDERMFDASTLLAEISEANPGSPEIVRWVPELIRRLDELCRAETNLDVKFTLESLAFILAHAGDERALPALERLLGSEHCNVGSQFESNIERAIEALQR